MVKPDKAEKAKHVYACLVHLYDVVCMCASGLESNKMQDVIAQAGRSREKTGSEGLKHLDSKVLHRVSTNLNLNPCQFAVETMWWKSAFLLASGMLFPGFCWI